MVNATHIILFARKVADTHTQLHKQMALVHTASTHNGHTHRAHTHSGHTSGTHSWHTQWEHTVGTYSGHNHTQKHAHKERARTLAGVGAPGVPLLSRTTTSTHTSRSMRDCRNSDFTGPCFRSCSVRATASARSRGGSSGAKYRDSAERREDSASEEASEDGEEDSAERDKLGYV